MFGPSNFQGEEVCQTDGNLCGEGRYAGKNAFTKHLAYLTNALTKKTLLSNKTSQNN